MKFSKYIKQLDEIVGGGTGAGQAGGPNFQSGDIPNGGDIATYSRKLFNGPIKKIWPNKIASYEDTFKNRKKRKK